MKHLKVAIVGTGVGIRTHLKGIKKCGDVCVIGVVGRSLQRAKELLVSAEENPQLACEWSDVLASNPDIICITTPPNERDFYFHSLKNYKGSLLVEKPVIVSSKDAAELKSCTSLCINHSFADFQLRGLRAFQDIRTWIREGEIGKPYFLSMFERNSAMRSPNLSEWQHTAQTGGGQLVSMGSHLLDLSVYLLGLEYKDVLRAPKTINTSIPRGAWVNANCSNPSDEFCFITVQEKNCFIDLKSTSISNGDRSFEFVIEGTEGAIEFRYRCGSAQCTFWNSKAHKQTMYLDDNGRFTGTMYTNLNPSVFRLAYPEYFKQIVREIMFGRKTITASLQDGIDNAIFLENSDLIER